MLALISRIVFNYQLTLPFSAFQLVTATLMIWSLFSLPGVSMAILLGGWLFHLEVLLSLKSMAIFTFVIIALLSLGLSLAYWLKPEILTLVTQLIMLVGLLFAPILIPEQRLPDPLIIIGEWNPFVAASKLIRSGVFDLAAVDLKDLLVVGFVCLLSVIAIFSKLQRRR